MLRVTCHSALAWLLFSCWHKKRKHTPIRHSFLSYISRIFFYFCLVAYLILSAERTNLSSAIIPLRAMTYSTMVIKGNTEAKRICMALPPPCNTKWCSASIKYHTTISMMFRTQRRLWSLRLLNLTIVHTFITHDNTSTAPSDHVQAIWGASSPSKAKLLMVAADAPLTSAPASGMQRHTTAHRRASIKYTVCLRCIIPPYFVLHQQQGHDNRYCHQQTPV